ncbi:hypothetical protein ACF052_24605 [Streptomyces pilosus]|uniref:hypothetical protein n=1 Tax=Streptomyces pilosus TaxID=28893 RepID=UPI0037024E4C
MTLQRAGVGEKVGTLRHTDIFGGTCDDVLTLKQVTEKRLVTTSVGAENNRGVCDQEAHTVLLTPVGDDLVYESDSKPSGRPEARLSTIGEAPAASSSGPLSGTVPGTSRGSAQVARPTPPDRRGRRAKGRGPGRSA